MQSGEGMMKSDVKEARDMLALVGVEDTSSLADADVLVGAELVRRISACGLGADGRRGEAVEEWRWWVRAHNLSMRMDDENEKVVKALERLIGSVRELEEIVGGPVNFQSMEWMRRIDFSRRLADGRTVGEALVSWADVDETDADDELGRGLRGPARGRAGRRAEH